MNKPINNLTEIYASQLKTRLATNAGMNQGQIEAVLGNFNKLVKAGGPEIAFRVMMNSFGNEDTEKACRTIKEAIQTALEKFNKENSVDIIPLSRLKKLIERHNSKLDQQFAAVEINGVGLSKDDIDRIKVKIPGCCIAQTTYTATASRKNGNAVKFALEIRC